jgi:hypothetical protein
VRASPAFDDDGRSYSMTIRKRERPAGEPAARHATSRCGDEATAKTDGNLAAAQVSLDAEALNMMNDLN